MREDFGAVTKNFKAFKKTVTLQHLHYCNYTNI